MRDISIVVDLVYGDSGKGATTAMLATDADDLVVRFNGGHQAGHTVCKDGIRHVFSSFGSGTLNGAKTFISKYCTVSPHAFITERLTLTGYGLNPVVYVDPMAMVTTPWDVQINRQIEGKLQHGSVGVGFGATVSRHKHGPVAQLRVIDLYHPIVLESRIHNILKYYGITAEENKIKDFISIIEHYKCCITCISFRDLLATRAIADIVFEGAQGIMLDMDHGIFPHVTHSNTTSKNAIEMIEQHGLYAPSIYYVMRSYLTRHGNGPMPNHRPEYSFIDQTNLPDQFQGTLRQGDHSMEELKYALNCDRIYSRVYDDRRLVITHLDQTDNKILVDGEKLEVNHFRRELGTQNWSLFQSDSPEGTVRSKHIYATI